MSVYKKWQPLQAGAIVDIIAPASRVDINEEDLAKIQATLRAWQLEPRIVEPLFGPDLLCASSDEQRFQQLTTALYAEDSQIVWCLRGGYGCTRLLPKLLELKPPRQNKLLIGASDVTALHLFLQQQWQWASIHGAGLWQIVGKEQLLDNLEQCRQIMFAEIPQFVLPQLQALNKSAQTQQIINSTITGGNLALVQTSLGTAWQMQTQQKIILLEEINEKPYRVDRMLEHCRQAGIFDEAQAIILGDFLINNSDAEERTLMQAVLQRFADTLAIPVVHCPGIGHGKVNHPVPLGVPVQLDLAKVELRIET